jgi:hypothetical protein
VAAVDLLVEASAVALEAALAMGLGLELVLELARERGRERVMASGRGCCLGGLVGLME